jgi:hypothetical protein
MKQRYLKKQGIGENIFEIKIEFIWKYELDLEIFFQLKMLENQKKILFE